MRHQPESFAKQLDYPDPADYSIINCPYCIDAREQHPVTLAGCLRHARGSVQEGKT